MKKISLPPAPTPCETHYQDLFLCCTIQRKNQTLLFGKHPQVCVTVVAPQGCIHRGVSPMLHQQRGLGGGGGQQDCTQRSVPSGVCLMTLDCTQRSVPSGASLMILDCTQRSVPHDIGLQTEKCALRREPHDIGLHRGVCPQARAS